MESDQIFRSSNYRNFKPLFLCILTEKRERFNLVCLIFRLTGSELWDFGDGTEPIHVKGPGVQVFSFTFGAQTHDHPTSSSCQPTKQTGQLQATKRKKEFELEEVKCKRV